MKRQESPLPGWFESAMLVLAFFSAKEQAWGDFGWNAGLAFAHWFLRGVRSNYRRRPFAEWYPQPRWPTYGLWTIRGAWLAVLAGAIMTRL